MVYIEEFGEVLSTALAKEITKEHIDAVFEIFKERAFKAMEFLARNIVEYTKDGKSVSITGTIYTTDSLKPVLTILYGTKSTTLMGDDMVDFSKLKSIDPLFSIVQIGNYYKEYKYKRVIKPEYIIKYSIISLEYLSGNVDKVRQLVDESLNKLVALLKQEYANAGCMLLKEETSEKKYTYGSRTVYSNEAVLHVSCKGPVYRVRIRSDIYISSGNYPEATWELYIYV